MAKKVGILSMQRIANYGSFLQAMGLKRILENLGCEVEFVDYHVGPPLIESSLESDNKVIRKFAKLREVLGYESTIFQKIQFILFKMNFSKKYLPLLGISEQMNYLPKLDCLIVGSDEVFNCIQKNANVGYSLELFGKNNRARKVISYAASFGNTTLDKINRYNKESELSTLLKKFNNISVRDENSKEIIEKLTGQSPMINLDPVLIYDYAKNMDKELRMRSNDRYILLYAYSGRITTEESNWIREYADKKNLKVYSIGGIHKCADKFIDCSPLEIFNYFAMAEEIITDTFHGSIFSIVMHKRFATIIRKSVGNSYGNEEKLLDLLNRVHLETRACYSISDVEFINSNKINFEKVDSILETQRKVTKNYLRKEVL
jgi:hypothetical protein